ncbi:Uncharacterised protein [Pseudomonas fluorescens]|jgi:hypothetical protein|uniref:Uncharacterized protein n=1 Tax=Pseudomonas fluorescens TaxID=294 RepID=A0A448DYR0_PSEFL|nr:Uncharacterised protein [Pseudomonas fluorescens]
MKYDAGTSKQIAELISGEKWKAISANGTDIQSFGG